MPSELLIMLPVWNFQPQLHSCAFASIPQRPVFPLSSGNSNPLFNAPVNSSEIKPRSILWRTLKFGWRSFRVGGLAKKLDLDIYHGLSHELPIWIEKSNIKTVVTIHDLIYLRYPEYYHRIDRKIYDQKFRRACKVANLHSCHFGTNQAGSDDLFFHS